MESTVVMLTAATSSVAVTLVSLMVPNAIDSKPVSDHAIEQGYLAAITASSILGIVISAMARNPMPFVGAFLCGILVTGAHNVIQRNGMPAYQA